MKRLEELLNTPAGDRYRSRVERTNAQGVAYFRCRCGRTVPADMMRTIVSGEGGYPLEDIAGEDTHRCDGCWTGWIRAGLVDYVELDAIEIEEES
jgi:hypothetical protein